MKGKIKFYKRDKKWGFIIGEDRKDYFFHKNDIINTTGLVKDDTNVRFEIVQGPKGIKAKNVLKLRS